MTQWIIWMARPRQKHPWTIHTLWWEDSRLRAGSIAAAKRLAVAIVSKPGPVVAVAAEAVRGLADLVEIRRPVLAAGPDVGPGAAEVLAIRKALYLLEQKGHGDGSQPTGLRGAKAADPRTGVQAGEEGPSV